MSLFSLQSWYCQFFSITSFLVSQLYLKERPIYDSRVCYSDISSPWWKSVVYSHFFPFPLLSFICCLPPFPALPSSLFSRDSVFNTAVLFSSPSPNCKLIRDGDSRQMGKVMLQRHIPAHPLSLLSTSEELTGRILLQPYLSCVAHEPFSLRMKWASICSLLMTEHFQFRISRGFVRMTLHWGCAFPRCNLSIVRIQAIRKQDVMPESTVLSRLKVVTFYRI